MFARERACLRTVQPGKGVALANAPVANITFDWNSELEITLRPEGSSLNAILALADLVSASRVTRRPRAGAPATRERLYSNPIARANGPRSGFSRAGDLR
jgi:hypothetical protein